MNQEFQYIISMPKEFVVMLTLSSIDAQTPEEAVNEIKEFAGITNEEIEFKVIEANSDGSTDIELNKFLDSNGAVSIISNSVYEAEDKGEYY